MRSSDRPLPLRAVRIQAKCPRCGKPADQKYRPFCSKRCADIDLGHWLKGNYVVPGREADEGIKARPATRRTIANGVSP